MNVEGRFLAISVLLLDLATFGQGTISFNTYIRTVLVTRVYAPSSGNPTLGQTGNGPNDEPAGTQDWTVFSLIGAQGSEGQFGAATTFSQLLSARGDNQPESSLEPAWPTTTFRTGEKAGFVAAATATLGNVPWNTHATVEMVAWDNSSGKYPTWTEASVVWQGGLLAAGKSGTFNVFVPNPTGGEATLYSSPDQHVSSFNLYYVPEPHTCALIILGVALVFWRRRRAAG
jgi:hypothetical protein